LQSVCPEPGMENCVYIHRGLYREYRSDWIKVNKRLADEYLGGKPLFTNPIPPPERITLYQPDLAHILDCLLVLYKHFEGEGESALQNLFARAMLLILAEKDLWDEFGPQRCDNLMRWL